MDKLAEFTRIAGEFEAMAHFITIYIDEAHAVDGWDFPGNEYKIYKYRDLHSRIAAAEMLKAKNLPGHLLVDTMACIIMQLLVCIIL